ncbi:putative cytosine deaminase [Diplocarpon rosae]|nr:putative cytosine deaminase [Diplocarpon rosae]
MSVEAFEMNDQEALAIAIEEATISYKEGGVPIGAALVSKDGKLLGKGHNQRVQLGSAIHHVRCLFLPPFISIFDPVSQGETSALFNSGRLPASAYRGATMFTTLSPCDMCLLYGISRVVIGENKTYLGGEAYLKSRGVDVVVLQNEQCRELMETFTREKPEVW